MTIFEDLGFKSIADRAPDLKTRSKSKLIPYNNPYLDRILYGIAPGEIVLIGGETGSGKSELAKDLLFSAASNGFTSAGFFLEADEGEIERRIKYKIMVKEYYRRGGIELCDFRAWMCGRCDHLNELNDFASEHFKSFGNVYTFYKGMNFTINDFKQKMLALDGKVNLIVVDHIHFFDLLKDNEQREMTEIMMTIRTLAQVTGIPIVIVAHLRKKQSGEERGDIPSIDDFHGSSALQKIANNVILFGSGGEDEFLKGKFITYMRVVKMREGGPSRTKICGQLLFDSVSNTYDDHWIPGTLRKGKFVGFTSLDKLPSWWDL